MKRRAALIAFASCLAATAGALSAEKASSVDAGAARSVPGSVSGAYLFRENCAGCHGTDGKGHGPKAGTTKPPPANLTVLSAQNGGSFPAAKIADVIRNGGRVLGHGSHDMPAWSRHFGVRGHPEIARAKVKALVAYIRSLQQP